MAAAMASAATPSEEPRRTQDVVLVGNPNVGKSALFGALTGRYAMVSNYPGTTVEITEGLAMLGHRHARIVDTPGAASFLPTSEDERVTRDLLLGSPPRAVVVVGDAKNLERTLVLALQLSETGLPFVVCLNMMDEAAARGIGVDLPALVGHLGVGVVATVAVRRQGIQRLAEAIEDPSRGHAVVRYPEAVERAIARAIPLLPAAPFLPRALALMVVAGDATLASWLGERMTPRGLESLEVIIADLRRELGQSLAYVIGAVRQREAGRIARAVTTTRHGSATRKAGATRLEALSTHPVWGLPILALVLAAAYLFVGVLGAQTLVEVFEDGLFGRWINPWAVALCERLLPWEPLRALLVGPYGVVTMALTYSLALVLPIVGTFFLAFGVLEDSGYLPRLAVMTNRLFKAMGLNGKAVLPMMLGLGCDTMATLTTRILETPKERLIVIVLLALGVPCSAQLTVVVAMLGGLPLAATAIWAAVVMGVILLVGRLASAILPGRGSDFVLELPPLRPPRPANLLIKTAARVEWYLKEAVPLFVLGTLILFAADRLDLLRSLERASEPLLAGALGLPRETAEVFVLGFLRRDFGAAGLYRLAREGRLDATQVLVAVTTVTLFIPCVANFLVIVKERGWWTGVAIAAFVFPFAVGVGAALNAGLRAFPGLLR
jgi:ferrous iron transport protein B